MAKVFRRHRAEVDLFEIWCHVARENESAADRMLDRIDKAIIMLSRNPLVGRRRGDLKPDMRSFAVGRHVLFYKPTPSGIELVRIIDGARDIDPQMLDN